MVPVFGLIAMGKGSFMQGIEQLTTVHAEKLNSVGGPTDPLPIGAAFTGLIGAAFTGLSLVNTFYWCTNQGIVQRTLASKSLAEGQKGALLTAVLKMLDPLVLVLPGLIAFHLYQDLPKADMAYPTLVNNVLPVPLVGFFGAVLCAENARPAGTGAARVDCVSSVSGFTESRHGLPDAGQ